MVSPEAAARFLGAPFLADFDSATRQALVNVLVESRAPAGAVLVEQDRTVERVAFLIDGRIAVRRTGQPPGEDETILELKAPTAFGESSFFRQRPSLVTIAAATDVWLLTLDHPAHDLLRRSDPRAAEQLALAAIRVLAEHFDLLDQRYREFLSTHAEGEARVSEWSRLRARLLEQTSL